MGDQVADLGEWRTSSYSQDQDCVEVRFLRGAAQVRNSRDRRAAALTIGGDGWAAFLAAVRSGEFDR